MSVGIGPGGALAQGRYLIEELIGEGGMAAVHRAQDTALGRTVAVKTMNAAVAADEGSRERFRREARSVAAINHANVVAVHDVGEEESASGRVPYIVMEYVEGRTLGHWVPRQPGELSQSHALRLISEVLSALAASHARGMVHRDIKPANVMVTADGSVKVMDFGIARALDSQHTALTGTGFTIGTPHYMSPEQFEPGRAVDGRSDLYAVGVVLYQLLTGALPFDGDSGFQIGYLHVTQAPPVLADMGVHAPPGVQRLVSRALAKDPADRFPDAETMRSEVEQLRRADAPAGHVGYVPTQWDRVGGGLHQAPTDCAPPRTPSPEEPSPGRGLLETVRQRHVQLIGAFVCVAAAWPLAWIALYGRLPWGWKVACLGISYLGFRMAFRARLPWAATTDIRRHSLRAIGVQAAVCIAVAIHIGIFLAVLLKLVMG